MAGASYRFCNDSNFFFYQISPTLIIYRQKSYGQAGSSNNRKYHNFKNVICYSKMNFFENENLRRN